MKAQINICNNIKYFDSYVDLRLADDLNVHLRP